MERSRRAEFSRFLNPHAERFTAFTSLLSPPVRALVIPVKTDALIWGHQRSTVFARAISSEVFESMHQARNRGNRCRALTR